MRNPNDAHTSTCTGEFVPYRVRICTLCAPSEALRLLRTQRYLYCLSRFYSYGPLHFGIHKMKQIYIFKPRREQEEKTKCKKVQLEYEMDEFLQSSRNTWCRYYQLRYNLSSICSRMKYFYLMPRCLSNYKLFCTAANVELPRSSIKMGSRETPLKFEIFAECQTTKARTGRMTLVHHHVDTPVFMPVGTQVI